MVTALTLYGLETASSLATACKLVTTTTGGVSANLTTKVGTVQGSGELFSLGSTATFPGTAVSATAGVHGFLYDVTALYGQIMASGTWTIKLNLNWNLTYTTMTSTMTCRLWKRTTGGVFTQIGSALTVAGPGASTTAQTLFTLSGTLPAITFYTGDQLYMDVWLTVTSTGGATTRTIALWASSNSSGGVAGQVEIDTPGYSPIPQYDSYKNTVLADSPIRYYRLNEASGTVATDLGSQAHNGTITGVGVTYNQGAAIRGDSSASSMTFNGTSGDISLPTTSLPTGASAWTMEGWFKLASLPAAGHYPKLITLGSVSHDTDLAFDGDTSQWFFEFDDGVKAIIAGPVVATGAWYHLVGTYNGTTATLFINGVQYGTATYTASLTYGIASLAVDVAGTTFTGVQVSEVALYSTALTSTQVVAHYNAGIAVIEDTVTRFRLMSANQFKDTLSRFRIKSADVLKDSVTRFRLTSNTAVKDIATRFRQRSANQNKDTVSRLRLGLLKDVALRLRVMSASVLKDTAGRLRLRSADQTKDTATRFREHSANQNEDSATRLRLALLKNVASRLRVMSANQVKDIALRLRVMSTNQAKDLMSRLRVKSADQLKFLASRFTLAFLKDTVSRFRIKSADQTKDAALRLRLALLRDVALRLRLALLRDVALRLRVKSANQIKDSTTRFRQRSADSLRDLASRLRLGLLKDIQGRFTLASISTFLKDSATRFRLKSADQAKDVLLRLRVKSANQVRDVASRLRLALLKDVVGRLRLGLLRDVQMRLRVMSANQVKDIASLLSIKSADQAKNVVSRFRQRSADQLKFLASRLKLALLRDIMLRFRVRSADMVRDGALRFRVRSADQIESIASRFRQRSAGTLSDVRLRLRLISSSQFKGVMTRFRLATFVVAVVDMASRLRLGLLRDVSTRFRIRSADLLRDWMGRFHLALLRDATTRFCLVIPYNVAAYVRDGSAAAHVRSGDGQAYVRDGTAEAYVRDGVALAYVRSGNAPVTVKGD